MDTQPGNGTVAESPASVETQPNILEILAGGFIEIAEDVPVLFI